MSIVERDVELDWLVGSPRWWTVTNDRGTREIVRVEFPRDQYFPDAKPEICLSGSLRSFGPFSNNRVRSRFRAQEGI